MPTVKRQGLEKQIKEKEEGKMATFDLTRRQFGKNVIIGGAVAAVAGADLLMLTGCPQQDTLSALVATLGDAVSRLAAAQGLPADIVALIKQYSADASAKIASWVKGTPSQMIIEALGILEDEINKLPFQLPYANLIDLAIIAVDSVIQFVTKNSPVNLQAYRAKVPHRTSAYAGKAPQNPQEFRTAWNNIVATDPKLQPLYIR